ncbi:hypothetical protein [Clostridium formicaceticum]|uniref:Sialidase domain-containing protein n=1 Tax=Clostridium formicaceticum TaxID=1497 RepID=A0AAC9RKR2_9CLOT|nr:hypothetical protein [Clostridium formicaceticum]AOY76974.1 hypothetical protein BJL90_14585 [Clostridium formicaceticum]ARE87459.1 hypothetical protein CLFO_18590 [Clostridium formicaceticum]
MHLSYQTQHCLVKTQENFSYYFYLNENKEIQYHLYNDLGTLIKTESLVTEIIIDFSATIDSKNQLHLICITKQGNMLYYMGSDSYWNHKSITKLDVKSNIYRYLFLLIRNDYTHIFCMKTNLLNPMVSSIEHLYWNEKDINKSTITTYLTGKYPSPYKVDVDSMNNLHILYKVFYRNNHQLYYSKFSAFNKKWSNAELISNLQEDHSHSYMLIDKKDNLHLIWCVIEKNNFTLKYKNKANIIHHKSRWSNPKTLSSKNANNLSPILLQEGGFLKVFSKQGNIINEIISEDYGINWTSISRTKAYKTNNPSLIRYSSNHESEKHHYKIHYVYGEILNDTITIFGTKLMPTKSATNINIKTHISSPTTIENTSENTSSPIEQNEIEEKNPSEIPQEPLNTPDPSKNEEDENLYDHGITKAEIVDFKVLLEHIEIHITRLVKELEKLEEVRMVLDEKNTQSSNTPSFTSYLSSKELLCNKLQQMDQHISLLNEEKAGIQEELIHLQEKFSTMEDKLNEYKDEYLILQNEAMQYMEENFSFISRIKNLFK